MNVDKLVEQMDLVTRAMKVKSQLDEAAKTGKVANIDGVLETLKGKGKLARQVLKLYVYDPPRR